MVVPPIYASYFLIVLPLLKLADSLLPSYGFVAQAALWVCYEYFLKTSGFLAYSYGNLGYSQYLFLPFARISGLFGVWGVSFLVVLPSALIAGIFKHGRPGLRAEAILRLPAMAAYAVLFIAVVVFGAASAVDLSGQRTWRVSLVQQNVDPWRGGYSAYGESLDADIRQSDLALTDRPDAVIWSETSFVPAIDWHTRYRPDPTGHTPRSGGFWTTWLPRTCLLCWETTTDN